MSRDNSFLYSGANSQSYGTRKEKTNIEKLEQKAVITPAAKVVIDLIEKEKANVADVRSFIIGAETEVENLKSELLARKMYTTYLSELQNKLHVILKAKPIKKKDVAQ